ncbi:MAG: hypothetical protein ACTHLR_01140 [Rhizomicrobium sp.]
MVFGLLMTVLGIGALCVLLYSAAVYALPVGLGICAGYQLMEWGVGSVAAIIGGFVVGGIVFGIGHIVLVSSRPGPLRIAVVAAFVAPAVLAGYGAAFDLSAMGLTSDFWQHALAVLGGAVVGGATFARLCKTVEIETATA